MTWWQIALIAYLGAMAWMGWEMWRAPNEEDMIDWNRCPCGCDVPMDADEYPRLHGDNPPFFG